MTDTKRTANDLSWVIVDADSHITEPPDAWTSRVPAKYAEVVPRVGVHPKTGRRHWRVGDVWYWPVAGAATSQAGWHEYLPSSPWEYDEIDPAAFNAEDRLKRLDEFGIDRQFVYPNIIGFVSLALMPLGAEVANVCVRAWNDFIWEWCSADHRRLQSMAMLPFWDIEASLAEMRRCVDLGFKGVLFANKFERIGLPAFTSDHWDRVYAAAQDFDVPINYHLWFESMEDRMAEDTMGWAKIRDSSAEEAVQYIVGGIDAFMGQLGLIGRLLTSGLCERFPRLRFVSVETGFGQFPFYLEMLDWYWKQYNGSAVLPLLPSEYFRRQCYASYWFEQSTLDKLPLYPNNFMFSTDFPHGTSLSPGPCGGTTLTPAEFARQGHSSLDPALRTKVLSGNATAVYKLDLPVPVPSSLPHRELAWTPAG
jgi:uncharacterized protein